MERYFTFEVYPAKCNALFRLPHVSYQACLGNEICFVIHRF